MNIRGVAGYDWNVEVVLDKKIERRIHLLVRWNLLRSVEWNGEHIRHIRIGWRGQLKMFHFLRNNRNKKNLVIVTTTLHTQDSEESNQEGAMKGSAAAFFVKWTKITERISFLWLFFFVWDFWILFSKEFDQRRDETRDDKARYSFKCGWFLQ